MLSGYQILPEIYDRWQQSYGKDFSSLILPRLLHTIKAHNIPASTMLDLACGTGSLALMMAKRGWEVIAVDGSEGMLREGRGKIRNTGLPVVFSLQDMRRFALSRQVALATCMFDAINHLTSPRDVQRCFQRVYDALLPGGYFVFDVNNELCFRTVWRQTEAIHGDDYTIVLQNSFTMRKRLAKSHVTLFVKKGNYFERKTETVRERYYPRQEIDAALRSVGFRVLECEDFNFTPNPLVGEIKTWWVVRRES